VRNFLISIVSAVKICKQCLQTDSAYVGLRPLDPTADFRAQTIWDTASYKNFWRRHCTSLNAKVA